MGIVRELMASKSDGRVRNVTVQVSNERLLRRSIQSLVIIDVPRHRNLEELPDGC